MMFVIFSWYFSVIHFHIFLHSCGYQIFHLIIHLCCLIFQTDVTSRCTDSCNVCWAAFSFNKVRTENDLLSTKIQGIAQMIRKWFLTTNTWNSIQKSLTISKPVRLYNQDVWFYTLTHGYNQSPWSNYHQRIRKGLLCGSRSPALQKDLVQFAFLSLKFTAQYFKCTLHKPQVIQD